MYIIIHITIYVVYIEVTQVQELKLQRQVYI